MRWQWSQRNPQKEADVRGLDLVTARERCQSGKEVRGAVATRRVGEQLLDARCQTGKDRLYRGPSGVLGCSTGSRRDGGQRVIEPLRGVLLGRVQRALRGKGLKDRLNVELTALTTQGSRLPDRHVKSCVGRHGIEWGHLFPL